MEPLNVNLKLIRDSGGWYNLIAPNGELGSLPRGIEGTSIAFNKIAEAIDSRGEYNEGRYDIAMFRTSKGFLLGVYENSSPYLTQNMRFVGVLISFDSADYFSAHIKLTLRATV